MNLKECYQKLCGNYNDVAFRLPSDKLIERFIGKFLEDTSFETLCNEISAGNRSEAFRAAHTLKGVCANLGFTKLFESVSRLTEQLRLDTSSVCDETQKLFSEVCTDYENTACAIREYFEA